MITKKEIAKEKEKERKANKETVIYRQHNEGYNSQCRIQQLKYLAELLCANIFASFCTLCVVVWLDTGSSDEINLKLLISN